MAAADRRADALVLDGTWRAAPADDDLRRALHGEGLRTDGWEPIKVPGHWRSTPAFSQLDGPLLHQRTFERAPGDPDERTWLVLDGVFYQGDVWLDGDYVGNTEGYFFPHALEVTEQLRARPDHDLAIEVGCPPQRDRKAKRAITGVFGHWDCFDPAWNPGGIWRPVRIASTGPVRIAHFRARCRTATAEQAVVAVRAVLDAPTAGPVTLRTRIAGTELEEERVLAAGENRIEWDVTVPDPARWWPRALCDQPLHDVEVSVVLADGEVSDRREVRIGLRTVELRDWVMHVNGERLFLKGANLGPSRMALGEATAEELRADVELAREAGLDLLRIHAHVTRPELYDAADAAGMLLWQDFPLQWGYSRSIRAQARRQAREMVDLLAHRPSVAVWCGHNEPMAIDVDPSVWGDRAKLRRVAIAGAVAQALPTWNKTVLDASVKRVLERTDGSRPVVAHSGVLPHLPQLDGTDGHLYFGWYHGDERDLPRALRLWPRLARFVSEFGAQAVPDTADFMEPERWPDLDWDRLAEHHALQKPLLDRHVPAAAFDTFEAWRRATQEYQALVVRRHIEELRRLKYRPTGGFCTFLLADGHEAVSWAVLDHHRLPKLGYEALTAACAPVIVVADRLPEHLHPGERIAIDVHVVSDLRAPSEKVRCSARLRWPGGHRTWQWEGDVPADSCVRIGTIDWSAPEADGPVTLDLELRRVGVIATNHDETAIHTRAHHH